jgi:hypothetical protein
MKTMTHADNILFLLKQYLKDNPQIRFGQALVNLNINQFTTPLHPQNSNYLLRDTYHDTDEQILKRIGELQ